MHDRTLRVEIGGRSVTIDDERSVRIGRGDDCEVVIAGDQRISRVHARVDLTATGWVVTNTGRWGLFVDGHRVERFAVDRPVSVRLADAADGPLVVLTPSPARGSEPTPGRAVAAVVGASGVAGPVDPTAPHVAESWHEQTVDRYSLFVGTRVVTGSTRIGRTADNDIVLDGDLLVSRHHAELRRTAGGFELVDLGSSNGTFVNGAPVQRAAVRDGDAIGIGRRTFVFSGGRLREYADDAATLVVRDARVEVDGGAKRLLDGVSFAVEPGELVGVIGPSGAGKSTLVKVLTGSVPLTDGVVTYNGRDLLDAIEQLGPRFGYVPQDDIIHAQLPLRRALGFAAQLRFAPDVSAADRDARIDEVMRDLGIDGRADLVIERLSGGQRKRASIALELLAEPALVFLDEPTSGLDPGFERSVMELLRQIADRGRTVVVITHATDSLELCDRLLCLAPGGRTAYYGPPAQALGYFHEQRWSAVFNRLTNETTDWAARFAAHPICERYVREPVRRHDLHGGVEPPPAPPPSSRSSRQAMRNQFTTLVRRNAAVVLNTRSQLVLLLAQAPVIALLLVLALGTGNLRGPRSDHARTLLVVVVLAATTMGLANACREIVRELPIYLRERAVGLHVGVYLASKMAFVFALGVVQLAVLYVAVVAPQDLPAAGALFGSASVEVFVVLLLAMAAAVALGLAVSALVSTDAAALVMIPVLVMAQLVLANGLLLIDDKPVLAQAAWASPSSWGFTGLAASVDLKAVETLCPDVVGSAATGKEMSCGPRLDHTGTNVASASGALALVAAGYLGVAYWALRRRDPRRRTPARNDATGGGASVVARAREARP